MARKKKVDVENVTEAPADIVDILVPKDHIDEPEVEEIEFSMSIEEVEVERFYVDGFKRVRLFETPHSTAKTVTLLKQDDIVMLLEDINYRWVKILTDDAAFEGYLQKRFIKKVK